VRAVFVALGVVALAGFALMLRNFIERPSNDTTNQGFVGGRRSWWPRVPPENERLFGQPRKWWEW